MAAAPLMLFTIAAVRTGLAGALAWDELRHYAPPGPGCRFRPDRLARLAVAIA